MMSFPNLGAAIMVGLGLLGCIRPDIAAKMVGIHPEGRLGISEIRATYGGVFFGLGAGAFLYASDGVYLTLALGWFGAATVRTASVFVDKSYDKQNIGGIVMEVVVGSFFLIH